ncbi:hypothetical protein Q763_16745 [Flavobacterium beibuense F44-8]|uniref:Molecular chaperone Skp n=1 Tax=Flavobacterium beibuense F44-8 TaxID=1406840 RepID=A0A0A2LRF1_9FLAO|nr:OmpH family outer membrane protein [Flavobacterium beibuense]KGO78775.1 hypothetical protein Q763_16745 [Flavobacterium beibuense F44-8]
MKKDRVAYGVLIGVIVFLTVILFCFKISKNSLVYVQSSTVFESFNMMKEMKKAGEKELRDRANKVDSLYYLLNMPDTPDKEKLTMIFIEEKKQLEAFQQEFVNVESEKIRSRISSYAKDFADANGYELILASQPNVNILYGENSLDVTKEFIDYINKKYEGGN